MLESDIPARSPVTQFRADYRIGVERQRAPAIGICFSIVIMAMSWNTNVSHAQRLSPMDSSSAAAQPTEHGNHNGNEHQGHAQAGPSVPLIDGSVNPELIPDEAAIRVLMRSLRIPADPNSDDVSQFRVRIKRAGLDESDSAILMNRLGIMNTLATDVESRIEDLRPSSIEADLGILERFSSEKEKLGAIVVEQYEEALREMSAQGSASLQQHLLHVKSRMKIYPIPDMSSNAHTEQGDQP